MKIGIIVGSIREGRKGPVVAEWARDNITGHEDVEFEIIDLKSFDLPLLTSATIPMAANKEYASAEVTRWSQAIDACDGFIFVTPEYNHSVPGAFKNAVDSLGQEWVGKSAAVVSYGADGGVRAVEHWRQILANFYMVVVRGQVPFSTFNEFDGAEFRPAERREAELHSMVDQLVGSIAS